MLVAWCALLKIFEIQEGVIFDNLAFLMYVRVRDDVDA